MQDSAMLAQLQHFVQQVHPLEPNVAEAFSAIWKPFSAKRKCILTVAGETERYLYFVLEGIQRAYSVNDEGRDATLTFMYPPSFAGVADSFLLQQPSRYYFETLTPSVFLRTDFVRFDELLQHYPSLERWTRLAISHALSGVLVRQIELQSMSAEQRFRALLTRSPHILNLIPHKYLANYLGMDATNFSKFLANVRVG
jgi:CRP-like cAMP-binding protein